jgi:hypothetical protein
MSQPMRLYAPREEKRTFACNSCLDTGIVVSAKCGCRNLTAGDDGESHARRCCSACSCAAGESVKHEYGWIWEER